MDTFRSVRHSTTSVHHTSCTAGSVAMHIVMLLGCATHLSIDPHMDMLTHAPRHDVCMHVMSVHVQIYAYMNMLIHVNI